MTGMNEVHILNFIHPSVHAELESGFGARRLWEAPDPGRSLSEVADATRCLVVDGGPVDERLLAQLPRLEIVASYGVGVDRIDLAAAARHGIVVTNTPGVLDDEVADHAVGLLLATLREYLHADRHVRLGKWPAGDYSLTASLRGRSVGILGLGRIGKSIARRLEGFGVSISYCGRHRQPDVPYEYIADLLQMAEKVDVLINVAPGGPGTRGLIDARILEALGPQGVFINVGRGSTVDQPALVAALKRGTIHAAGLDVFDNEPHVPEDLKQLDNVLLTPHMGAGTEVTRVAMGRLLLDNVADWFAGRGPRTPVPAPKVPS